MTELEILKEIQLQIEKLKHKKDSLNEAIKTIDQQIYSLQKEYDQLREKRKNEKALLNAIDEFEIREVTTTCDGKQLKGTYNYGEGSLMVIMECPYPSISNVIDFPDDSLEEYAESRAKELLIKLYKDNK